MNAQIIVVSVKSSHREKKTLALKIAFRLSKVDCVSIRRQGWSVISQGSDTQNGPSGTLCHSA